MKITLHENGSFPLYENIIRAIIGPKMTEQSFIDLCSCEATITRNLQFKEKTYVDVLDCWDIPGQMDKFIQTDVLGDHEIFNKHYDIANCSDGIEHLSKEEGFRLIERMKNISDKQILFTPLGNYMIEVGNPDPKCHKSGWHPEDFEGFASIVCPIYHPTLGENGLGAFWVWKCDDIEADFQRVNDLIASFRYCVV